MKYKNVFRFFLIASGLVLLGFVIYKNLPYFNYQIDQNRLEKKFVDYKPKKAEKKVPKKQLTKPMPTKLIIPKIKFNQNVLYASNDMKAQMAALKKGPTHYGGTSYPGQIGNTLIGGHYISYTFKYLNTLKEGNEIELKTPIANFKYKVIETKVVNENALNLVKGYGKKNKRLLTLYTCVYPSSVTKSRFLAVAEQVYP